MTCETCYGYEFVTNQYDPDGMLIDCPDCRAIDARPLVWCPVHSTTRVDLEGCCAKCVREAEAAIRAMEARRVAGV